jgi:hypothetical protein
MYFYSVGTFNHAHAKIREALSNVDRLLEVFQSDLLSEQLPPLIGREVRPDELLRIRHEEELVHNVLRLTLIL